MNLSNRIKTAALAVSVAALAAGAANAQPSATRVNKHVSVSTAMLLDGTALQTVITHDDQAFGQSGEGFATVHCEGSGTPETPKWSCKPIATAFVAGKGMAQDLLQEVIHSTGFVVGLHNQAVEKILSNTSFNVQASNAPVSATGGSATGGNSNATGGTATGGNSNAQGGSSSATGGNSASNATGGTGVGGTAVSNSSAGANSDSAGNTSVAVSGSSSSSSSDATANNTGSDGHDHHD